MVTRIQDEQKQNEPMHMDLWASMDMSGQGWMARTSTRAARGHGEGSKGQYMTCRSGSMTVRNCYSLYHEEYLYEISLIPCSSHLHNMCLPHGKPYAIELNVILDSSSLCCAWLCCHTHAHHIFHASLPFCHHHAVALCVSYLNMSFSEQYW